MIWSELAHGQQFFGFHDGHHVWNCHGVMDSTFPYRLILQNTVDGPAKSDKPPKGCLQHVGSAGGVCPAWNKVDCDYMWWVSAAVCCSCSHGVDFTVFFHIKCGCSQVDFISFFSDAIDHWMFWQCPNLTFLPNLAEKSTITCNLQRFHLTRFAYIYRQTWSIHTYIYIYITYTRSKQKESDRKETHGKKKYIEPNQDEETMDNQTWYMNPTPRTMCTHQHTSSVPCVHMNTPAAHHVYTSTHQQRTMCTHQHTSSVPCVHMNTNVDTPHPTPPHVPCVHINTPAAYHVYTWTHQQRTMCTHEHISSVPCVYINTPAAYHVYTWTPTLTHPTPPHVPCVHINTPAAYHVYTWTPTLTHPTPPHMSKFRANPPGRPNMLQPYD